MPWAKVRPCHGRSACPRFTRRCRRAIASSSAGPRSTSMRRLRHAEGTRPLTQRSGDVSPRAGDRVHRGRRPTRSSLVSWNRVHDAVDRHSFGSGLRAREPVSAPRSSISSGFAETRRAPRPSVESDLVRIADLLGGLMTGELRMDGRPLGARHVASSESATLVRFEDALRARVGHSEPRDHRTPGSLPCRHGCASRRQRAHRRVEASERAGRAGHPPVFAGGARRAGAGPVPSGRPAGGGPARRGGC